MCVSHYPSHSTPISTAMASDQGLSASDDLFLASPQDPSPLPTPNLTPSYWLQTSHSPDQGVYRPDEPLDEQVDVAIVGSGITGISAAYHLTQKLTPRYDGQPRNIVVLEARDFCSGATGRNGGHCTPASVLSYDAVAAHSQYLARFLDGHARDEVYGNDVGKKTDEVVRKILTCESRTAAEILMIVRMAAMRARKAATAGMSPDADADVQLVSGSNWHLCRSQEEDHAYAQSIENAKRGGLSDFARQVRKVPQDEWQRRLHDPQGITAVYEIPGSTLHPRRLVKLLHRLASESAAKAQTNFKVYTWTPVERISSDSNTLHTSRGDVKAKYIIHATNGYASHLLPQLAGPSGVVPTRAQCRSIVPTKSPAAAEPLWEMGFDINDGYEYLQQRPSDGADANTAPPCIFGGGRWASKNKEFGEADDAVLNPDVSSALQGILPALFPVNFDASTTPSLEWTAVMGWTKTNDPFVGPVLDPKGAVVPRQYIAAGYSGHGMTRAFSCAEVVADMICAQEAGVRWEPPVWFPLCYLTGMPETAPITAPTAAAPRTHAVEQPSFGLFAAGSNSGGQLGIGHLDDSHTWARPQCIDGSPFPPIGTRIESMCGGANHTLALVSHGGTSAMQVWTAGDTASQFPHDDSSSTTFRPLSLPLGQPKHIAAAWDTSYIVYSSAEQTTDDCVYSFGKENDFGQSGKGQGQGQCVDGPAALVLPVPSAHERSSRVEITHIQASMRHCLLLATWLVENNTRRHFALIGWGAGRHGQLGAEIASKKGPSSVAWTPRVVQQWWSDVIDSNADFSLSLGRDHTVVRVPEQWTAVDVDKRSGAILRLGSNKSNQLEPGPASTDIQSIQCTWTGTLYLTHDGHIIGKGKNDHGQHGSSQCDSDDVQVRIPCAHSLVCGSEHALALTSQGNVYGWGWNEHGNLACGSMEEDQWMPVIIWHGEENAKAVDVWAGCATTFVQVLYECVNS